MNLDQLMIKLEPYFIEIDDLLDHTIFIIYHEGEDEYEFVSSSPVFAITQMRIIITEELLNYTITPLVTDNVIGNELKAIFDQTRMVYIQVLVKEDKTAMSYYSNIDKDVKEVIKDYVDKLSDAYKRYTDFITKGYRDFLTKGIQ